jgi:3-phenylpropionate/trans-cinnamate dioxygenase ferredoxin subunit
MATEERICSVSDVPVGEARRFDLGLLRVCIVRLGDAWYAIGDSCTHQETSLSEGGIDPDEETIECRKHGSMFSLESGKPLCLPATRPTPVYNLRIDGDSVMLMVP